MAEYSPYKNKFPQATREGLVEFKIPEKKKGKGKREKPLRNEHKNIKPQREEANTPQLENKSYNSAYLQNVNSALKNITAPKPFEYDYTTDALYNQYKKEYERNADLAARDAAGKASALTGGYGNTYAQTVSQQVENSELSKLSDKIPELYSIAYNRYRDENDADLDRLYALLDVDRAQFEKYLDDENLKLDKAQLAYKMQDKSPTTQSQSDKTQNKTEAENTEKVNDKTPQITQPDAEDIKAQSVLKLSNMYKEYADYIYDDNDRRDVAQEIEALCYIGSLSREEADTLITALKLENFR